MARDPPCLSSHLYTFLIDSLIDKIEKCSNEEEEQKKKELYEKANQVGKKIYN
jgi:translation initiation factor IF-2